MSAAQIIDTGLKQILEQSVEEQVGLDICEVSVVPDATSEHPAIAVYHKKGIGVGYGSAEMTQEWRATAEAVVEHLGRLGYPGYTIYSISGRGFSLERK